MQWVSMLSDLTLTSPLLLQLHSPWGSHYKARPAEIQSHPKGPLASAETSCLHASPQGSGPLDQPCSHSPIWGSGRNTPTDTSPSFLSDYNKQSYEKPNSGTAEPALCHTVREASMLRPPHISSEAQLKGHHHVPPSLPFDSLSASFYLFYFVLLQFPVLTVSAKPPLEKTNDTVSVCFITSFHP